MAAYPYVSFNVNYEVSRSLGQISLALTSVDREARDPVLPLDYPRTLAHSLNVSMYVAQMRFSFPCTGVNAQKTGAGFNSRGRFHHSLLAARVTIQRQASAGGGQLHHRLLTVPEASGPFLDCG